MGAMVIDEAVLAHIIRETVKTTISELRQKGEVIDKKIIRELAVTLIKEVETTRDKNASLVGSTRYATLRETAKLLRIKVKTLMTMIEEGEIKSIKIGGKELIDRSIIWDLVNSGETL